MTLSKAKIGEAVAEQIGYPKNQSSDTVEILLEIIKRTLESNEDVLISGFGKFCVKTKHERRGSRERFRSLYLTNYRFVPGVDEIVSSIYNLILVWFSGALGSG